jgi:hypothetical protein
MKLEFKTEKIVTLPDRSREVFLEIKPEYQVFIGYLLEGIEGMCYHTIVDDRPEKDNLLKSSKEGYQKLLKVTVTSDFFNEVMNLLADLQGYDI